MSTRDQLDKIEKLDRLRAIRNICLTLGCLGLLSAITCIGGIGVGNPKNWSSAFVALQASGYMRWLILPLGAVSVVLVTIGLGLTAYISQAIRTMTDGKLHDLP